MAGVTLRRPRNFSFIDENVAGSAYIYSVEEVDWLANRGIEVVISLVPLDDAVRERMKELGIENHLFPIENFSAPPVELLAQIVDLIREHIRDGRRVLVHCLAGCGRTGTVLAAYLVSKGMHPDEAIEHLRSLRPCSIETQQQYDAVWFYHSYLMGRDRSPRRRS
ncbi:MAG: dual specificity protein phosphatase family protein [Candidatus Korarchaeota archaeon]|nr:dual specificity protein phosphatase family protein [Candidatus Korarchaeota archaeon]